MSLPKVGDRFTDEELHAKFGVPTEHGIRVSKKNKCIVLVHLVGIYSAYTNTDRGTHILYMGQNSDQDGLQNQAMSGNNLALKRAKEEGYTVLYFIKENDMLVFRGLVECDKDSYKVEMNAKGKPRVVIEFTLRLVEKSPSNDIEATREHVEATARPVASREMENEANSQSLSQVVGTTTERVARSRIEVIDSPPLSPEEIADIEDFLAEPDPSTISKEEFLAIIMDDKKLENRIRDLVVK